MDDGERCRMDDPDVIVLAQKVDNAILITALWIRELSSLKDALESARQKVS